MSDRKKFIIIHTLTALPLHCLNRDERGLPKQTIQGGVVRGVLSSQSLKRAARKQFEAEGAEPTFRSRDIITEATKRAAAAGIELDEKVLNDLVIKLTQDPANAKTKAAAKKKKDAEAAEVEVTEVSDEEAAETLGEEKNVIWLSDSEIDELVEVSRADKTKGESFLQAHRTPSLAIAAFGRMFAHAPEHNTQAAIAVSPAVSTHKISVDIDYLTAVDDLADNTGAGHLAQQYFTSGVYYRTVAIDPDELKKNWIGWDGDTEGAQLKSLLRAIITALPTGKLNSTAAHTRPSLVFVEQADYRGAYTFENPVKSDGDGFLKPTLEALAERVAAVREFDSDTFGGAVYAGEGAREFAAPKGAENVASLPALIDTIVGWMR